MVAEGWDNAIYRVGEHLAARLPRRALAAALILGEQRWLGQLQAQLPLPIPAAVRIGTQQQEYPWHWSITPWLAGETADLAPPDAAQEQVLAQLLSDLHPRNALVADGRLCAVIDWGDLAGGDRATDLAAIWMLLPDAASRKAAIVAYGAAPAGTWRRARGWAALFAVILLDAGLADDARMAAIGRRTVNRISADDGRT